MIKEVELKNPNLNYDNVDDKKELYNIIENFMDEGLRQEFLIWCCKEVNTSLSSTLRPGRHSTWHPKEVFWQVMSLAFMHQLDLGVATSMAEQIAKKGKVPIC
jgi:hypothetical protein